MDVLFTSWRHSLFLLFRTASVWDTHCLQSGISVSAPRCHEFFGSMARSSKTNLVPAIVHGVTCFPPRFAVYRRGSAAELAVESWTLAATSAELVFQGCVVRWYRHHGMGERVANEPTTWRPSDLCAIVVFTSGTAMIQGINEHVANDLTELFPQLENKEVAASPERKYSLMS